VPEDEWTGTSVQAVMLRAIASTDHSDETALALMNACATTICTKCVIDSERVVGLDVRFGGAGVADPRGLNRSGVAR